MSCGFSRQMARNVSSVAATSLQQQQPNTIKMFTAYYGSIELPLIVRNGDVNMGLFYQSKLSPVRTELKVINHPNSDLPNPERYRISLAQLRTEPTHQINIADNQFYGGILCAIAQQSKPDQAEFWAREFQENVRPTDFYERAAREFPGLFNQQQMQQLPAEKIKQYYALLVEELNPVDALFTLFQFCNFFNDVLKTEVNFNRLSFVPIVTNVQGMANAFFADYFMAVGTGGKLSADMEFLPLSTIDVVAHEVSHSLVAGCGGLRYEGYSGANNESYADVVGFCVEKYIYSKLNENESKDDDLAGQADWLIGEDCYVGSAGSLRSLSHPESCGQPSRVNGQFFVNPTHLQNDYGGVHTNSGIPNHAFYLCCQKMTWQEALMIWYKSLCQINDRADFRDLAEALINNSGEHRTIVETAVSTTGMMNGTLQARIPPQDPRQPRYPPRVPGPDRRGPPRRPSPYPPRQPRPSPQCPFPNCPRR